MTAVAPMLWGTTYLVTTELLPADRPLLAATLRALPAGLLILLLTRRLPTGSWWWKSLVLGVLNIAAFFALLFVAAYRLPGGVAATMGAVQPLLVILFASGLLGDKATRTQLLAGVAGVFGVALLVLQATARLDLTGVLAALGGALVMAAGTVLAKRWGLPAHPLVSTSWQLVGGGLVLLPLMLLLEGVPTRPLTAGNIVGYAYLAVFGTALAYTLWFRGIQNLPAASVAFLGLLSPIVAVACGWAVLQQPLSAGQGIGAFIVLAAVLAVNASSPGRSARPGRRGGVRRR